jgi:hypothetical protein
MAKIMAEPDDHNLDSAYLKDEQYVGHFRVAILGSARLKPEDDYYQQIVTLSQSLGKNGYDVVTGGGPGIMEAANQGHQEGRKNQDAHSIGLTIELPWENHPNRHLDMHEHFNRFSDRLDEFLLLSNVAVLSHGGVGTCLEFFYIWQHIQVKHMSGIPMILLGDMWDGMVEWLIEEPLKRGLISPEDFDNLYIVHTNEEAMEIIEGAQKAHDEQGDGYTFRLNKYKALKKD